MPQEKPVSILLVDDNAANLAALEAALDSPHFRLVRATSGEEALRQVLDTDFAAILMDVMMPKMDGFETARLIRSRPHSAQTPIIFISAVAREKRYEELGYAAGAVDYLTKPLDEVALRAKLAVLADLFRVRETLRHEIEAQRQKPCLVTRRIYGGAGHRESRKTVIRLLVVEDSDTDALQVREALKQASATDFLVTRVVRLRDALDRLQRESFDAVLLDLSLPDSAGIETVQKFRALAAEMPVLVLTSVWDEAISTQALEFGLQGFLLKDQISPAFLEHAIRYAIESKSFLKRAGERQLQEELEGYKNYQTDSPAAGPAGAAGAPRIDEAALTSLIASYRTLVTQYLRAVRQRGARPKAEVQALAARLAGLGARASHVVKLHLVALHDLTGASPYADRQIIANDARLLLVDLLGTLLDLYGSQDAGGNPGNARS